MKQNIGYGYLGDWLTADGRDGYAEADNIVGFIAVVFAVLLRSQTAEGFQLLGTPFELAVLPQDFQLQFEIVYYYDGFNYSRG